MTRQLLFTLLILVTVLCVFYVGEKYLVDNYVEQGIFARVPSRLASISLSRANDPLSETRNRQTNVLPNPSSNEGQEIPQATVEEPAKKRPHIIFIVADDLGFNDVSWHNKDIIMPTLETLAKEGVILEQNYVLPICTPSRAAFMTGIYPHKMGRQHRIIRHLQPSGISVNYTFMPGRLKPYGYKTHLIGKWHLGFCNEAYLPRSRGFDTFYGFHTGSEHYYEGVSEEGPIDLIPGSQEISAYDFWENETFIKVPDGVHSSELFINRFEDVVKSHPKDSPLFVFMSLQNVHAPLEPPQEYTKLYMNETNLIRRKYLGLVTNMDDIVKEMMHSLTSHGLYNDSIIVFTTDNGGATIDGGDNRPLKGNKNTFYEGGTRGVGFIHSPLLKKSKYTSYKMIHAVDWLPTFVHLAGGNIDFPTDGVNQWEVFSEDGDEARKGFVYNLDEKFPFRGAIRDGDWKLLWQYPGKPDGQFSPGTDVYNDTAKLSLAARKPHYLYNLKRDPNENDNLALNYPHIVEHLQAMIQQHLSDIYPADDPMDSLKGLSFIRNSQQYITGWCDPS